MIDGGLAAPGLHAWVLIQKYLDHLPLYRIEQISTRYGVPIARSTLAEWVGRLGVALQPLATRLAEILREQTVLHADETPVSQLDPGAGKTKRAYLWAWRSNDLDNSPKIIGSTTTGYLYDGWNVVQELNGATSNGSHTNYIANLINGPSLDERYARILGNASQKQYFLTDHLGSTIKLLDENQPTLLSYSYEPYGKATNTSGSIDNPYQYTGRENDGVASLMHYRNRYYSTDLHRFVSRDPIGFEAGPNQFAYVDGAPTMYTDPTGKFAMLLPALPALGNWAAGLATAGLGALLWNKLEPILNKAPENARDPEGPKAPGKPGEAEGFEDPKGGEKWSPNPNPGKGGASHGWEDSKGNVWCPSGKGGRAHGGPHWDVQTPGGGYRNVRPVKGK